MTTGGVGSGAAGAGAAMTVGSGLDGLATGAGSTGGASTSAGASVVTASGGATMSEPSWAPALPRLRLVCVRTFSRSTFSEVSTAVAVPPGTYTVTVSVGSASDTV